MTVTRHAEPCRVGGWFSGGSPRPPMIEPDIRFCLIWLSDGVHVIPVAGWPWRTIPERRYTPSEVADPWSCTEVHLGPRF